MATFEQCAEAVARVASAHPPMTVTKEMARVWFDVLESVPGDVLAEATRDVLGSWSSTYPPGPGVVKTAALTRMRADEQRSRPRGIDGRGSAAQAQHIQALKANVAAAFSLDQKTRDAGKSGAVYRRIADGARRAGTADLPDWTPPGAQAPQEHAHGPWRPTHTDTPTPASNRDSEPRWGLYDDQTEREA